MPDELRRMLTSYEFLDRALGEHGAALPAADADKLRSERDEVFLDLLRYSSADPRITLAQIDLLLASLTELASEPGRARMLSKACRTTAARLASQIQRQTARGPAPGISPQEAALLDSLPDRASLYDRDYRFIFTNRANAAFHGIAAADFVGRPCWSIVGARCFEELAKPSIDACIAGRPVSMVATHRAGGRLLTYAVTLDPVRNDAGNVVSTLIVARDVSGLSVDTPKVVWPAPGE